MLIDSAMAVLVAFTPLGDNTIERVRFVERYLPLTKGWTTLYFAIAMYVGYLTFVVM